MIERIKSEIHKGVIGHEELVEGMLIALLAGGHILVEGPPGVAKTTAVNTLAKVLGLEFHRIQFTPDLLPADITGGEILDLEHNRFSVRKGPIFTHLLLADEINRSGHKVQSALLEAMAERQVTLGERSYPLEDPFMVLATANPIDQEGTYDLPEASLDRFMFKLHVGYNSDDEEFEIVRRAADGAFEPVSPILDREGLLELKASLRQIHVDDEILRYLLAVVRATREPGEVLDEKSASLIAYGAGPRGSIDLYRAARARAFLEGRDFVTPGDVARMSYPVLRHRLILEYRAEREGADADALLHRILEAIPAP
jgi:MoxR-like ATPase